MRIENVLKDDAHGVINQSGEFICKGTIYTMLLNAETYDKLIASNSAICDIQNLIDDINLNSRAVSQTGMFDFFEVHEWLTDPKKEGRIITELVYCKDHQDKLDSRVKEQIENLKGEVSEFTKNYIKNNLNLI